MSRGRAVRSDLLLYESLFIEQSLCHNLLPEDQISSLRRFDFPQTGFSQ